MNKETINKGMPFSKFKKIFMEKAEEQKTIEEFLKLVRDSLCFIETNNVKNDGETK